MTQRRKILSRKPSPPTCADTTPALCWNKKMGGFRNMIHDALDG